jgi:hypothetical protein
MTQPDNHDDPDELADAIFDLELDYAFPDDDKDQP